MPMKGFHLNYASLLTGVDSRADINTGTDFF